MDMKTPKGLSLIEILVVLVITGVIAACVSASVIGGYYMLKQAEHKSRAMSISHVMLQEFLAMSYETLDKYVDIPQYGNESNISQAFERTRDNTYFNWTVNVKQGEAGGINNVPYKNITVETLYTEVNTKGEEVSKKTIRLANLVPYPLIHIKANRQNFFEPADETKYEAQHTWGDITPHASVEVLEFNYPVPKDVIVMYNLAITYDTAHPPTPIETVYTRCNIDNGAAQGIITRTPISTQIFINNILEIDNVAAGPHTIHIQWYQESTVTKVWLRAYDVTIIALERKI
jgi:prepilin-type N-terminal cleavage/methylation domain-containing protein